MKIDWFLICNPEQSFLCTVGYLTLGVALIVLVLSLWRVIT